MGGSARRVCSWEPVMPRVEEMAGNVAHAIGDGGWESVGRVALGRVER